MKTTTEIGARHAPHSPERRQFSVLCWRWWCDSEYKNRDIAAMVEWVTGCERPLPDLPAKQCPSPDTCECECHDGVTQ